MTAHLRDVHCYLTVAGVEGLCADVHVGCMLQCGHPEGNKRRKRAVTYCKAWTCAD